MAKPQMRMSLSVAGVVGPVLLAAIVYFLVPLLLVIVGATDTMRPGGFGRGFASLFQLGVRSLLYAAVPALAATGFCAVTSLLACFHRRFREFYCVWLVATLFTNPVFLVFGFKP